MTIILILITAEGPTHSGKLNAILFRCCMIQAYPNMDGKLMPHMTFDAITLVPKLWRFLGQVFQKLDEQTRLEKHFIPVDADGNNTKILKTIYYPEAFYILPEKWN